MRRGGSASPIAASEARTRSRDSPTALSASPTMVKAGRPAVMVTCASTSIASMPWNVTVRTRATKKLSLPNGTPSLGEPRRPRQPLGATRA